MMRSDGKPFGELGEGFDFGELLDAVRAAATPEEQESANEAISVVTTRLRSNRPTTPGTVVRRAASRGRRVGTRLGAAIVVTVFTASASLAISGQLPSGARDVAAAFLAQVGLFPVPRLEASGQLAAAQTTEEPFGPADGGRDARLLWMPPPQVDDGIDPTRVGPPPVIKPRPIDPPPAISPPPGVQPPPVIDPAPAVQPPPVNDPPHSVQPPPVIDPGEESPPADDQGGGAPPADDQGEETPPADDQGEETPPADDQGEETPPADDQGEETPPADDQGEDSPPADDQGEDSGHWPPSDKPGNGPPPFPSDKPGNGPPPFDTPGQGPPPFDTPPS